MSDYLTTKDLYSVLSKGEDSFSHEVLRNLRDFVDYLSTTLKIPIYHPQVTYVMESLEAKLG